MLGRRQYFHIGLNISSMVFPMVAGLLVVPDLITQLGTDRFGVLSISWVLVGYFGLLDLGLARGLTQYLASQKSLGSSDGERAFAARNVRFWMVGIGFLWSVILLLLSEWITQSGLKMPESLRNEASLGWVFLSLSVPPMLWAASSIGVMEANSRFTAVNTVRLPLGIATFIVPWLVARWSADLGWILGGLLVVRLVSAFSLAVLSRPHFAYPVPNQFDMRQVWKFGGWLSISNMVGPFLSYFDRFAIGALVSMSAVTFYTVPFDVLIRLPTVPMAMMAALFPLLAQSHGSNEFQESQLRKTFEAAGHLLISFWLPGMFVCGLVGNLALDWWIGPEMASSGGPVWAWLSLGILLNGFAHLPYTLLHSAGRSDVTAKLHLAELAPYLLLVWWALINFGIEGAAAIWALRCAVDTVLLYLAVARLRPALRGIAFQVVGWAIFACVALWGAQSVSSEWQTPWPQKNDTVWLCLAALIWAVWHGRKLKAS